MKKNFIWLNNGGNMESNMKPAQPNNFSTPQEVIVEKIDTDTVTIQLRVQAEKLSDILKSLDDAKIVTQETLQIEFSI